MRRWIWLAAIAVNTGCGTEPSSQTPAVWDFGLPAHFPAPKVPEDNPMSEAKVALGRRLFYDTRLSGNETQSCASCHDQAIAFTDGMAHGLGSTGQVHPRGAMGLTNVGYSASLNWANPVVRMLEAQALIPMFGETPVELGMTGREAELFARLGADPDYPGAFEAAFEGEGITLDTITKAIAAFERTLISADSPYDRYIEGEVGAMSAAALRGMDLFMSERLECFHCHGGFNFTASVDHQGNVFDQAAFFNNGLYNVGGTGRYPEDAPGLYEHTGDPADNGRFKAPSLRNVAVTAPYMHDGRLATLDDVLDHYSR
ncbi:MAG: di-heme enzyme, partial [Myxococcales bacterium]|nr:di-heme enzyme [Myxococcales bacterium]